MDVRAQTRTESLATAPDTEGASAISYSTWCVWVGANGSTAAYALVNITDWVTLCRERRQCAGVRDGGGAHHVEAALIFPPGRAVTEPAGRPDHDTQHLMALINGFSIARLHNLGAQLLSYSICFGPGAWNGRLTLSRDSLVRAIPVRVQELHRPQDR